MKRGGPLRRVTPLRRTRMKRARQQHLSGIRPEQRDGVNLRDNGTCRRCGLWTANIGGQQHHRQLRSRGGDDRYSNLILLCASCHNDVHALPADATRDGFMVHTLLDPARIPVNTWEGWRYFADDGSVLTEAQHEGAS